MNEELRPSGRVICTDQAIAYDLNDTDLRNHQFLRLVALNKRFTRCNFSYSDFDSVYLRHCVFDSCKFIGARFINSNLSECKFEGCTFDYAHFTNTFVEPEILNTGLPGNENLQQKFARTLRLNFQQIGDSLSVNKAIKIELEATRIHLYKAWKSKESYYRKKYSGFNRVKMFLEWFWFVLLDFYWGNGESPIKLLRSIAIVVLVISALDIVFLRSPYVLSSYGSAIMQSLDVLLGVKKPPCFSDLALAGAASLRYVLVACFVSIIIKRLSRR